MPDVKLESQMVLDMELPPGSKPGDVVRIGVTHLNGVPVDYGTTPPPPQPPPSDPFVVGTKHGVMVEPTGEEIQISYGSTVWVDGIMRMYYVSPLKSGDWHMSIAESYDSETWIKQRVYIPNIHCSSVQRRHDGRYLGYFVRLIDGRHTYHRGTATNAGNWQFESLPNTPEGDVCSHYDDLFVYKETDWGLDGKGPVNRVWYANGVKCEGLGDPPGNLVLGRKDCYHIGLYRYNDLWVGFESVLEIEETNDAGTWHYGPIQPRLTVSSDGSIWQPLFDGRPIIELGDDWDSGMIICQSSPIIRDGRLLIYYQGFNRKHNERVENPKNAVGLASWDLAEFHAMIDAGIRQLS